MRKDTCDRFRRTVVLGVLLAICSLPVAAATRYDDMTLQITTPISSGGDSTFGYMDYRATLTNSGMTDHTIELVLPQDGQGYGNHIQHITRKVTIPAGSTATISLFQPPLRMYGNGVGVVIDGRYQQETLSLVNVQHCQTPGWQYHESYCILLSRQIGFDDVNTGLQQAFAVQQEEGPSFMSKSQGNFSLALSEFPVSEWSQNWLSYSRYHGILLAGGEWAVLPDGVKRALLEYVRCGGSLSIVGPTTFDGEPFTVEQTEGIFKLSYPGFGIISATSRKDISTWGKPEWELLKDGWDASSRALRQSKSIKEANDWFPVIEDLSIPVRGLLLIVLIFAVLIGPANLFILTRKKRQMWLFGTVPLLSIVASFIVFGYASFSEGWKGYTRTQSLTILDEDENLASSIGIAAFYCPLTPQDGLHFEYETECTAQINQDSYREGGNGRTLDWTSDQHLASGWITSRIPSHFKLRKSQMRREKIVFSEASSGLYDALNGFGSPVESLYYADAAGTLYHAEHIPPGAKITLQRLDQHVTPGVQNPLLLRDVFTGDWHSAIDAMLKDPLLYLRPNCYIAVIKEPLFVEQALRKQKTETFESVVYGISQGAADAG